MREHLKIKSDFDQLPLDVIVLRPAHPKGIIQISHGMCEHKERYLDFMEYLYHLGYVCLIHDHQMCIRDSCIFTNDKVLII